jgi:hypothetical protein
MDWCKASPWKYLGNSKCCTTKYAHCEENADMNFCKGGGWNYLGSGKCCTTSSQELQIQCYDNYNGPYYNENKCKGSGGKYLGNGRCCWGASASYDCKAWCSKQYWEDRNRNAIDMRMPETTYVDACVKQQIKKGWECE